MQQKLRSGGTLMIIGGLIAAIGEIVNAQNMDVLSSAWRLSLGLIVMGTFVLLIGLSTFSSASNEVNGFGFAGSILLTLGALVLIVGTIALDWIIVPFLVNLADTIAATINQPAAATENELNNVIATLNGLGSSLQKLFPGAVPHVAVVHIPKANGTTLVNSVLVQLDVPTIERLQWWGRFGLSGGPLTPGSLMLGLALLFRRGRSSSLTLPALLLVIFALLNLLCQFLAAIPAYVANLTAVALFLTLAWMGLSTWLTQRGVPAHVTSAGEVVYEER